MSELNRKFLNCVDEITRWGYEIKPRGLPCKELLGYQIRLSNPRDRIITVPARDLKLRYLLAELIWYISGDPQHETISKYAPFWKQIAADDGTVNSNYGFRLMGYAPVDLVPYNQWENVKKVLIADRDTRQAMMHINLPFDYTRATKDVPCTLNLQWFIREDKLHLIVTMRSNDVILGFGNDVFQFTVLQEMMLCELNNDGRLGQLELGEYVHESHSMHLYATHYEMAEQFKLPENQFAEGVEMQRMVYNADIGEALVKYEREWREIYNCDPLCHQTPAIWNLLPAYWQNLITVCFGRQDVKLLQNAN